MFVEQKQVVHFEKTLFEKYHFYFVGYFSKILTRQLVFLCILKILPISFSFYTVFDVFICRKYFSLKLIQIAF